MSGRDRGMNHQYVDRFATACTILKIFHGDRRNSVHYENQRPVSIRRKVGNIWLNNVFIYYKIIIIYALFETISVEIRPNKQSIGILYWSHIGPFSCIASIRLLFGK